MCISLRSDANELFLWTFETVKKTILNPFSKTFVRLVSPVGGLNPSAAPFDERECELSEQIIRHWRREVTEAGGFHLGSRRCCTPPIPPARAGHPGNVWSAATPARRGLHPPVLRGSPPEGTTVWKPFL